MHAVLRFGTGVLIVFEHRKSVSSAPIKNRQEGFSIHSRLRLHVVIYWSRRASQINRQKQAIHQLQIHPFTLQIKMLRLVLLLLVAHTLPHIQACGAFFPYGPLPVAQSGEVNVFGINGDTVTMHVQINYEGPAQNFSWVLPLPYPPEVSVGSDLLFLALFHETAPSFEFQIMDDSTHGTVCGRLPECDLEDTDWGVGTGNPTEGAPGATILEEGSVGPFDFVVLEAADNDPTSVFRWLEENGYNQLEGSDALLNYYALNGHVFVAMRLRKGAESGEIQPVVFTYKMPAASDNSTDALRRAIACVPTQLTSVAVTDNMPIHVFILGDARAVPLNYIEIELDDSQVDWFGCQDNTDCYDDDYRNRFDQAASSLVNQSFVTEYAGTNEIMANTIAISTTAEDIATMTSLDSFFSEYHWRLPPLPLVDAIVAKYTSSNFDTFEFNATGLAQELDEKVLQPASDAQAFVDGFSYLTRLYARLSPESMTKDPFFAFRPDLSPVSNVHRVTGVPICGGGNNEASGLNVTLDDGSFSGSIPASFDGCDRWSPGGDSDFGSTIKGVSTALQLTSWGFAGDEGVVVRRSEDGSFDTEVVTEAILFGDGLVMNQTIPEYTRVVPDNSNVTFSPMPASNAVTATTNPPAAGVNLPNDSMSTESLEVNRDPANSAALMNYCTHYVTVTAVVIGFATLG